MAATNESHLWTGDVPAEVLALCAEDSVGLVKGSTFARRVKATDPEHGSRLCDHGRLLFQECPFCAAGVPALPDPTFEEMRENARKWLT